MLIMSQQKDKIIYFGEVHIWVTNKGRITLSANGVEIAEYKTEERAKEILADIMKKADVGARIYIMPEE